VQVVGAKVQKRVFVNLSDGNGDEAY